MTRFWGSVAFRLALGYGLLVVGAMTAISAIFYVGTVGVLVRSADAGLTRLSGRFLEEYRTGGAEAVRRVITQMLTDHNGDEDTEVYLLTDPSGRPIAGNLNGWNTAMPFAQLVDASVIRDGRPSISRLLARRLANGDILVVGRDMRDRRDIEILVWRALLGGCVLALLLASLGAYFLRSQIERRIAAIRRTAIDIEAGDLSRRIPVSGGMDEFARLARDINHMLDRIEQLMAGVRHVSNAIAHDLRTPLGRIRGQLDEALRLGSGDDRLTTAAHAAIAQIDEVIRIFDRLLQIAEAESGARRRSFEPTPLDGIIADVVELYDAAAEARGTALLADCDAAAAAFGDRDLLASAVANLVDNALKYAGDGATVRVRAWQEAEAAIIAVTDNGPGIPAADRPRVIERFYRLEHSRGIPGNGLGLSIVEAIALLHSGKLVLSDAAPGLSARLILPRAEACAAPRVSLRPPLYSQAGG